MDPRKKNPLGVCAIYSERTAVKSGVRLMFRNPNPLLQELALATPNLRLQGAPTHGAVLRGSIAGSFLPSTKQVEYALGVGETE